jgi:hypothetical protein
MKLSKLILILAISGSFLFNACKDEEKDPEPTGGKSKTELIAGANWKLTKATFNPAIVVNLGSFNDTFINLFDIPLITDCQKDNMILFNADGTMTIDNGTLKCAPSEPQTAKDGNWTFLNNETQIEITNSEYFKLISSTKVILNNVALSETEMTGQTDYIFTDPIKGPVNTKISFTFTK